MKIAICEDDQKSAVKLHGDIRHYFEEHAKNQPVEISLFYSGEELLACKHYDTFDAYFLDIYMLDIDGLTVARKIRLTNTAAQVVFCTSSPDFAIDGYSVRALSYLLKPYTPESLSQTLQTLLDVSKPTKRRLVLQNGRNATSIYFDEIVYVESEGHSLRLHLFGQEPVVIREKLGTILQELATDQRFLRCHQSYVVNMDYIKTVRDKCFILYNGLLIPVKAKQATQFINSFIDYAKAQAFPTQPF